MKDIPIRKIHRSTKQQDASEIFTIRDVHNLLGGKDLVHALHRHDFFFILALQKGTGAHEIDFTRYEVSDNTVFILRPGQVHKLELQKDCTGFLIEFPPAFYHPNDHLANQRFIKAGNKNICELETAIFKKLLSVLTYIFNEFTSKQDGYTAVIKANLDIFFIELSRQSRKPRGDSKKNNSYTQERFEFFLEQLEKNITTLKQVSQYADLLNLSVYQLNAITKTSIGKLASEMINEQIILEAKRYLLATPNQVKDIADHLGYEDISYFIRFFKKHTGYSPEAFRKNSL